MSIIDDLHSAVIKPGDEGAQEQLLYMHHSVLEKLAIQPSLSVASIVVGNALAGDTGSGCTYLDPGDGTGIQAALAAAAALSSPYVDVYIRRGTYALSNAVAAAGLEVPVGCTLRGAGIGLTIIVGAPAATGVPQTVLDLQTGSTLSDLSVIVPDPAGANTFTTRGSVGVSSDVTVRNVYLQLGDNTRTTASSTKVGFLSYGTTQVFGVSFQDVAIHIANATTFGGSVGFYLSSSAGTYAQPDQPNVFTRCSVTAVAGMTSGIAFVTNVYYTKVTDLYIRGINNGIWLADIRPISGTVQGIQVDNVDHDAIGCLAAGGITVSVICGASESVSTPRILDTRVTNIRSKGSAASSLSTLRTVYVQCQNGVSTQNMLISQVQGTSFLAGLGGIEIRVDSTASTSLQDLRVQACALVGDLIFIVGAVGAASNATFVGNKCRNLEVNGSTGTNAIVIANRITGTYTDSGTATTAPVGTNIIGP